jgi:hypothetical protein
MWLALADGFGIETFDTVEPVLTGPTFELLERRQLGLVGRQHHLAAAPVGDILFLAKPIELFPT